MYVYNSTLIERRLGVFSPQGMQWPDAWWRAPEALPPTTTKEDRIKVLSAVLRNTPALRMDPGEPSEHLAWVPKNLYLEAFFARLFISGCLTQDPNQADLFFIGSPVHTHSTAAFGGVFADLAKRLSSIKDMRSIFPHFNRTTAPRHVLFSRRNGNVLHLPNFWTAPFRDARMALVQRVAMGKTADVTEDPWSTSLHVLARKFLPVLGSNLWDQYTYSSATVPNVLDVPYAGLLSEAPRQGAALRENSRNISRRDTLVSAIMGAHGTQAALRQRLLDTCTAAKPPLCRVHHPSMEEANSMRTVLELKRRSIFCLEPDGDWPTPFRSGILQDVELGCIPVRFSDSAVWAEHWTNRSSNTVFILSAKDQTRTMQLLRAIGEARLLALQRGVAQLQQRMTYLHVDAYLRTGSNAELSSHADAFTTILRGLLERGRHARGQLYSESPGQREK